MLRMPIVIGAKRESSFADPIGLLTDCHRRIERFLAVLVQVSAQAGGGQLTSEQRTALETVLLYFREAAPKHTADEEQTLFPRLRSLDRPVVKAILTRVDELEAQHGEAERSHTEIDRLGRAWLAAGSLSSTDATRLAVLIAGLMDLYPGHIAMEEIEVFPVAASELDRSECEAMGGEMAARRTCASQARSTT
jgi:hemerythrin-like domain-containing protein